MNPPTTTNPLHCTSCDMFFKTNKSLQQHLKCNRHTEQMNKPVPIRRFQCNVCAKKFSSRQSLHVHKRSCVHVDTTTTTTVDETTPRAADTTTTMTIQEQLLELKKERLEMKAQIAMLLDKQAGATTTNNSNTTNIENQHINININAFGNENTDYLDDKAILACIGRVYKSIPSLLEKIHFDPKHPENHNIRITNKKLPYASVMGNNQKWKTVDRKDAIETMVLNGYNMLDGKYTENKDSFSPHKQENFEGFQSKFESEDKDLMKQIKTEVDMMVLNGGG